MSPLFEAIKNVAYSRIQRKPAEIWKTLANGEFLNIPAYNVGLMTKHHRILALTFRRKP